MTASRWSLGGFLMLEQWIVSLQSLVGWPALPWFLSLWAGSSAAACHKRGSRGLRILSGISQRLSASAHNKVQ